MKKSIVLGVIIIVILVVAWYLISPIFNVVEVDEASPLDITPTTQLVVKDAMESMDEAQKKEFEDAVKEMNEVQTIMVDEMPPTPSKIAEGVFKPRAHEVEGKALLIDSNGQKTLRFEDFFTINGPELHIYLSSELSNDDIIDLGIIKATKGNVNYALPEGIDTNKYNKVLVWCKPFSVLFSYAELS